jgi:hypothetical protein
MKTQICGFKNTIIEKLPNLKIYLLIDLSDLNQRRFQKHKKIQI